MLRLLTYLLTYLGRYIDTIFEKIHLLSFFAIRNWPRRESALRPGSNTVKLCGQIVTSLDVKVLVTKCSFT